MRHAIPLIAMLVGGACMAPVGDDPGDASRKPKMDAGCKDPEQVTEPITIRTEADFAKLPTGCWDLYSTLRLEGSAITSLAKLGKLVGVDHLEIVDTNLARIDTQMPLTVWGAVSIIGNKQLASLENITLDNADNLTTAYTIRNNAALASLDGVKYMKSVEGELRISDNPALGDIVLDELTGVAGNLTIANTGATRIDLGSLQTVGRLELSGNPKLAALVGLTAQQVKGDFVLRGNPALADLGALATLTRITGSMTIDANGSLAGLDAFGALQWIDGALAITGNPKLERLGKLNRLGGIGLTVTITGNPALAYCTAHEIDHCVNSGAVTITNNKTGTESTRCPCWCNQ